MKPNKTETDIDMSAIAELDLYADELPERMNAIASDPGQIGSPGAAFDTLGCFSTVMCLSCPTFCAGTIGTLDPTPKTTF